MDVPLRKVTARVDPKARNAFARPHSKSRPASPTKAPPTSSLSPPLPPVHPKARITNNASLRKLSSSSSLSVARASNASVPGHSRPNSPQRSSRVLTNGEPSSSPKARIMARPISRSGMSTVSTSPGLEPRQRALTAAPAKLKISSASEDRPRSGSVILHHALSISDLNAPSASARSQPSPLADPPVIDLRQTNTPPLAPLRIRSKVTGFIKSTSPNVGDPGSRPLSPPYATTRPIHTRSRAPSITSLSLNGPPFSAFYPITTASPAANPHRFTPRRAPSPTRPYTSPTLSSEPSSAKRFPFVVKADPALIPLPPHSPPISALSLSSKSSVSKTSVEQTTDSHTSSVVSHVKCRSIECLSQPSPLLPQADARARTTRDRNRSRSTERSPRDLQDDSDSESDGSERQLRAEAKTNRKIADLEITNRSLLAINASLETTKNRQAKEIRDLRRKLRESRLILPPRTYKVVTSALDEEDEEDEESDIEEGEGEDEVFQRVKNLIDGLIESGKQALEMRTEDVRASLATKVLNADELRSWRGSGHSTRTSFTDKHDADDETIHNHPSLMAVAVPDSGDTSCVESDEEPAAESLASSAPPPITITHSL